MTTLTQSTSLETESGLALRVETLSKRYGHKDALQDVSFEVKRGSCFGLLGPNGAGKTTTMRIITGLTEADTGTVEVLGLDVTTSLDKIRPHVGYIPQSITLYEKLSAYDNLVFFGKMYGLQGALLKQRIEAVLKEVGLSERAKDAVDKFSGGMKRRINIAAALLHQPKLIIMDEPTVGIDPQSRNHIFKMIRDLTASGVTVLYSTHYMEEVEALCDELAIIDGGRVIVQGSLDDVIGQTGEQSVYLETAALEFKPVLSDVPEPLRTGRGWTYTTASALDTLAALASYCRAENAEVKRLEVVRPSLEAVFLSLTGTNLRDE